MNAPSPEPIELHRSRFTMPPHLTDDPLAAGTTISGSDQAGDVAPPEGSGPAPTKGSSAGYFPGRPRAAVAAELAEAIGGALVILYGVAWALARWAARDGRQLREPLPEDYDGVANPLARILTRHVPIDLAPALALSIKDGATVAGVGRRYVARGPLLERPPQPEERA